MKPTLQSLEEKKRAHTPLTMLTCYDYSCAKLFDTTGLDMLLVGDSLGNVILGLEDTTGVTMEDMIVHSRAVARGSKNTLVITDMPFLSYQVSDADAVYHAGQLIRDGRADAVKLEGAGVMCDRIRAINAAGIGVIAHLGMTPQSATMLGGFKVQARDLKSAQKLIDDALAVEEAGAIAVVLECVPAPLATKISQILTIPTIGIGAGNGCDGQVLVMHDMLGMFHDYTPKFVQQFATVGDMMQKGVCDYIKAVHARTFPDDAHAYTIAPEIMEQLRARSPRW